MPNRKTHVNTGMLAGALASLVVQTKNGQLNVPEFAGTILGGTAGGRLPDVVDPPDSPNHRGFGHSPASALGLCGITEAAILKLRKTLSPLLSHADRYIATGYEIPSELAVKIAAYRLLIGFATGVSAGNISHLLLDSSTPAGIKL